MSKKLLGHVGVDSGQLMVTDPCYINMFKINEFNPQSKYYDKVKDKTVIYPDDFQNYEDYVDYFEKYRIFLSKNSFKNLSKDILIL